MAINSKSIGQSLDNSEICLHTYVRQCDLFKNHYVQGQCYTSIINLQYTSVQLVNVIYFCVFIQDEITRMLELTKPLTVGAAIDHRDGYVGCMRGLRVNGVLMDMRGKITRGEETYGVHEGNVVDLHLRLEYLSYLYCLLA